jgi:putative transposase
MHLTHKIALLPTPEQADYFARACGTARMVWNWALNEWNRLYAEGRIPKVMALKKQFNGLKYQQFPWLKDIHRDAHAQPFADLARAYGHFFSDMNAGKPAQAPQFKKKGRCQDSFYVANDKFSLSGQTIRLPKVGNVSLRETLRFAGKILSAMVSRQADRWYLSVQVDVPDTQYFRRRTSHTPIGAKADADPATGATATLSSGEAISLPQSLKAALRRAGIRRRKLRRKEEAAKAAAGLEPKAPLPQGTQLSVSNNRRKSSLKLARTHVRIANLRADFCHKLTTRLCRENQTVVIEDLHAGAIPAGDTSARTVPGVSFEQIRQQIEYKVKRYGNPLIVIDGGYPGSCLCSCCGWKNEALTLKDREWTCPHCGARHDRNASAAPDPKRLATATALPVASPSGNGGAAEGNLPSVAGKVTPVRHDRGQQNTSGAGKNAARMRARARSHSR